MFSTSLADNEWVIVQWGVVIGVSLAAAITDIRGRRIPNWLTIPAFGAGVVWAGWIGGWLGLLEAICGTVILAAPFVFLFLFAGGGAGDAKLMGAIGAWVGVANGVIVLFTVVVTGAILGIGYALVKRRFDVLRWTSQVATWPVLFVLSWGGLSKPPTMPGNREVLTMPYGVSIFAGVCIAALGVMLCHTDV